MNKDYLVGKFTKVIYQSDTGYVVALFRVSKSSLIDITYINGIGLSPSKDISIKEIKLVID